MSDEQRLSLGDVDPAAREAILGLNIYVGKGSLDKGLLALVDMRASQINGCAWCLDMHAAEARAAGIDQRQIDLVAAWHEARPLYTQRQQAALALTEAVTLIHQGGVSDEIWEAVVDAFDEREIAQLLVAIGVINVWNRVNVTSRTALPAEPFVAG